ncbi:lipoprotein lipase-like [Periplaneta americana]|uniref:lipoprotein lipase-like n=1 Tax=Periplaneta americana TaxID=6978 RepID=UPI0037E9A64E
MQMSRKSHVLGHYLASSKELTWAVTAVTPQTSSRPSVATRKRSRNNMTKNPCVLFVALCFVSLSQQWFFNFAAEKKPCYEIGRSARSVCFDYTLQIDLYRRFRKNETTGEWISDCSINISKMDDKLVNRSYWEDCFNPDGMTYIIIHGWNSNGKLQWVQDMTKAILNKTGGFGNVFSVDWSSAMPGLVESYLSAARHYQAVGDILAWFLKRMVDEVGLHPNRTHVISHSFGAYVMQRMAQTLVEEFDEKLLWITGLDQSLRIPDMVKVFLGLQPSSNNMSLPDYKDVATFAEILHMPGLLGVPVPQGHVDFFFDGRCITFSTSPLELAFGHNVAHHLYTETIWHNDIWGIPVHCGNEEKEEDVCSREDRIPVGLQALDYFSRLNVSSIALTVFKRKCDSEMSLNLNSNNI